MGESDRTTALSRLAGRSAAPERRAALWLRLWLAALMALAAGGHGAHLTAGGAGAAGLLALCGALETAPEAGDAQTAQGATCLHCLSCGSIAIAGPASTEPQAQAGFVRSALPAPAPVDARRRGAPGQPRAPPPENALT